MDTRMELEQFLRSLTNQPVSEETGKAIEALRMRAHTYARWLVLNIPGSREKALAKTHLEDSVMWAVKAMVLNDEATRLLNSGQQALDLS